MLRLGCACLYLKSGNIFFIFCYDAKPDSIVPAKDDISSANNK